MEIPTTPVLNVPSRPPTSMAQTFKLAFGLSILITALAAGAYVFLQPVIPVFYTLSQPDRQLVAKIWVFLFPGLAWMITLLHFSLLKTMRELELNIQQIFAWSTVGIIGIAGLLLIRIIFITI